MDTISVLVTQIAVIIILISALGMMTQPLFGGKPDLLWLVRPMGRWLSRLPIRGCRYGLGLLSRLLRRLSTLIHGWRGRVWQWRAHWGWYFLTVPAAVALAIVAFLLYLPTEFLPRGRR